MEGISFIVRVKNEEDFLEKSLRSLSEIKIPHDIHVILNMCTDRSREIAETLQKEGMPIHIHTYDYPLSRAGYEILVTDSKSKHSFVEYSKWCLNKATYAWIFRWDADLFMTDDLRNLINNGSWKQTDKFTCYHLPAVNSDSDSAEDHLFSGPYEVIKYIFWEYTSPIGDRIVLDRQNTHMLHLSSLNTKKSYWKSDPWFMDYDSDEARIIKSRYEKLTSIVGPELKGQARRANPECNNHQYNVMNFKNDLKNYGIDFHM